MYNVTAYCRVRDSDGKLRKKGNFFSPDLNVKTKKKIKTKKDKRSFKR